MRCLATVLSQNARTVMRCVHGNAWWVRLRALSVPVRARDCTKWFWFPREIVICSEICSTLHCGRLDRAAKFLHACYQSLLTRTPTVCKNFLLSDKIGSLCAIKFAPTFVEYVTAECELPLFQHVLWITVVLNFHVRASKICVEGRIKFSFSRKFSFSDLHSRAYVWVGWVGNVLNDARL